MSSVSTPSKVMFVGVVPPPVHGQSLATRALFDADLTPIEKIVVEIRSSKALAKVGKFSLSKALGLFPLVAKIWGQWIRHRPSVLYYTAGSGAWVPFSRDLFFLSLVRPLFRRTIIHYHSGDLVAFLNQSRLQHILGKFIYGRGAWTIRLGKNCSAPNFPGSRLIDVPNGVEAPDNLPARSYSDSFRILFLGNLFESKGVHDLIDAVSLVSTRTDAQIALKFVGSFVDASSAAVIQRRLASLPSNVTVPTPAPAYGHSKWAELMNSDVLVFPSYYCRENLPLVVIEAMAAGLPVIGANWRGISSLIEDGKSGYIVPVSDPEAIASALTKLIDYPDLRHQMGKYARTLYERNYTIHQYINQLKTVIKQAL